MLLCLRFVEHTFSFNLNVQTYKKVVTRLSNDHLNEHTQF